MRDHAAKMIRLLDLGREFGKRSVRGRLAHLEIRQDSYERSGYKMIRNVIFSYDM